MTRIQRYCLLSAVTLSLAACSSWSKADPAQPVNTGNRQSLAAISTTNNVAPVTTAAPASNKIPSSFGPAASRQTIVGRKVAQLRSDQQKIQSFVDRFDTQLHDIQGKTESNAQAYYASIAGINAKLQGGTTPGNPILVEQSQSAQTKLDAISADIATLNVLANDISSNASVASYLLESVRATYGLSGAVDEDHEQLTKLEDDVNRMVVQIDRQLTQVNSDINRRTSYLSSERRNLQTLALAIANGEMYGQSLANRAFFSPAAALPGDPDLTAAQNAPQGGYSTTKPLVMIRFDRPNVDYDQAVYLAASEALQRYPNVGFEIVAVAPANGNPAQSSLATSDAQSNAEAIQRSMIQMGIPGNRIKLSSTRSPMARTPEVHIFLR
ncbi:MAG TPA: hypothetical protein VGF14_01655 [Alphaproteobacteria bacterium]